MSDPNDHIALRKGWTRGCYRRRARTSRCEKELGSWCESCALNAWEEWLNPEGKPASRPDFTGTLKGVAGMMRELGPEWEWCYNGLVWECYRGLNCGSDEYFTSPDDRPGDCVGEAWLSVFGKEDNDAV